jgi:hypothetical protein
MFLQTGEDFSSFLFKWSLSAEILDKIEKYCVSCKGICHDIYHLSMYFGYSKFLECMMQTV